MAVTYRHGGVARIGFLHKKRSHGFSDDIAAPDNHHVCAGRLNPVAVKQSHDTCRSSAAETRQSDSHTSDVYRMKAVDILAVVNRLDNTLL